VTDTSGNPWYFCGSTKTFRSISCLDREPLAKKLVSANERIKRLEEAGDAVLNANNDDEQYEAMKQWHKAKEAKL
jgi:hypothetical protein